MKKILLSFLIFLFYNNSFLSAQSDSSYYDLGRFKLDKELTQSVTVKGSELDKFPFSNLSDALGVWFHGLYSNKQLLVYVVDGVLISDVNTISIYDIKEVTLVQNSLSHLSGANHEQQLILITTKNNAPKNTGITVAGQTHLVKRKFYDFSSPSPINEAKSEVDFYHQLYLSARKQIGKTSFSLSGSYLRDAFPKEKMENSPINVPDNLDRVRLRGFVSQKIAKSSSLLLNVNYSPQIKDIKFWGNRHYDKNINNIADGGLRYFTKLGKNFVSSSSINYNYYNLTNKSGNGESSNLVNNKNEKKFVNQLLIQEDLRFTTQLSSWKFEPSINFALRYNSGRNNSFNVLETYYPDSIVITETMERSNSFNRLILLTPALSVSYKNVFNLNGGITNNLTQIKKSQYFPFISSSLDVIRLIKPLSVNSFKIFTSWAKTENFKEQIFGLEDFSIYPDLFNERYNTSNPTLGGNDFQIGGTVAFKNSLIVVTYNLNLRNYKLERDPRVYYNDISDWVEGPASDPAFISPPDRSINSTTHRLGIVAKLIEKSYINWTTSVSIVDKRNEIADQEEFTDKSLTGGLVNRIEFLNFFCGIDLPFRINEKRSYSTKRNVNSYVFQSTYLGYNFKNLEVYFSARNPTESTDAVLLDPRRYFGLGFKLTKL